jgi:hypothetical protein
MCVSHCRVRVVVMHILPSPCSTATVRCTQSEKVGPQQRWLCDARPRTRPRKGLTRGRGTRPARLPPARQDGVELRPAAALAHRREGTPRVSHLLRLRQQRAGDRGSGELRQIELVRARPALRLGDEDRARPVAALDAGLALTSFLEPGADVAPVLQPRLAVLVGPRPLDQVLEYTRGQALLLDALDVAKVGAEAEPDAGGSRRQSGCTCERRAQLSASRSTETDCSIAK